MKKQANAQAKPEPAGNENPKPLWVDINDGKSMLRMIEALVKHISNDEDARNNFNLILAAASNDKLQVMEVKKTKSKAKAK